MPKPINIDVEFDPVLAAKSESGYYKYIFLLALGREQGRGHIFTPADPKVGGFFMIDIEGTMVIEVPT